VRAEAEGLFPAFCTPLMHALEAARQTAEESWKSSGNNPAHAMPLEKTMNQKTVTPKLYPEHDSIAPHQKRCGERRR
jgi:hypothetical protein